MSESVSKTTTKERFKKLFKDNGSKNMMIFAGVTVVGLMGAAFFGSGDSTPAPDPNAPKSSLRSPPIVGNHAPGDNLSPAYTDAIHDADANRINDAKRTALSAIPTPILQKEKSATSIGLDGSDQEGRPEPPTITPPSVNRPAPPVIQNQTRPVQQIALDPNAVNNIKQQLNGLGGVEKVPTAKTEYWYDVKTNPNMGVVNGNQQRPGINNIASQNGIKNNQVMPDNTMNSTQIQSRFKVPVAGTILYSRLIGQVNSDTPGPIIAEILQGPYAGARLLGSFQFSEAGVVMNFTSMTVPYKEDGEDKSEVVMIRAVAVDTAKLGTAMATDIDHHILEKVGVAAATAFVSGFGQALAQSGSTSSVNAVGGVTTSTPVLSTSKEAYIGAGAGASAAGQAFQQIFGNRKTTITVDANTPFGLLFLANQTN